MTSTIPNEVAGIIRTWLHDDPGAWGVRKYVDAAFVDFRRKRIANKEYGYVHLSNPNTFVARYKCSWVEADRRFKVLLVTRRMTI